MSDAEVEVLNQEDLFFSSPNGRLKLKSSMSNAVS